MVKQTFSGDYKSLILISKFIESEGEKAGLNEDELYAVKLAVDEACTNIIEHAYEEKGDGNIVCECINLSDVFEVILNDKGKKFDPDSIAAPNIGAALKDLKSRGAGMFLIKKLIDEVRFEFDDELGTTLSLKKIKNN